MRKSWALCLPLLALNSAPAFAINTIKDWDGQQSVQQFGCPDSQTYGQVITVRKTAQHLNKFTFELANGEVFSPTNPRSMVVRGEVYAWDGSEAAGTALYESEPRTIAYAYDDFNFHKETFRPPTLSLLPGKYIVFLSIAKDYEQCTPGFGYALKWGAVEDGAYKGGSFYYQDDIGYGAAAWTTQKWGTLGTRYDLAFKADLTP